MTFYSHVDPCTNQLRVVTQILESHNKKKHGLQKPKKFNFRCMFFWIGLNIAKKLHKAYWLLRFQEMTLL